MEKNFYISANEKKALVDYFSGELSKADSEILNSWLEKSDHNKLLFDQMADIWQASHLAKLTGNMNVEQAWNEIQNQLRLSKKSKSGFQSLNVWLKVAAIFIFAFMLGGIGNHLLNNITKTSSEPLLVEYVAPLGSRSFVKMPDGSKIWLNAGTTLTYKNNYGTANRDVNLSGEAYFEVAKNPDVPFIVQTSDIHITALGTQFNVKAYNEEKTIETTLVEGSVRLEGNNFKLMEDVVLKKNEKAVFVKKDQTVELIQPDQRSDGNKSLTPQTQPELKIISAIEPEPITSWKDERWIINNEKLGELSKKLERRYAVNFIFDNELLKDYSFGGTLEDETLEQVLEAIRSSSPIKYLIEGKTVYIMADSQKMEKFKHLLMR